NGVEGDLVSSTATTARYSFDFDEDFVIDGDDSEEVEIVAAFSAQDGTFADNTKVTFTVSASQIIAEGSDDVSNLSGTATSKTQTLSVSSATVDGHKWQTAVNETVGNIDFFFTVDADDEDYDVLTSSISATASSGVVGTLELVTGDASTIGGGFKVESGDTATFRVRYNFNTSGTKEVKMTSVAGKEVPQDKQLSPSILLK
ncbi:hypothetical protein K2P96_01615, partial [Patescibacteria group bacterium]|nr:hypothetical protein [Patescibacteria group bacterium]